VALTKHGVHDRRLGILGFAVAALGPVAVSGLLVLVRGEILTTNAALVLVVVVVVSAIVGGRWGGALAAVVAAACFDFFFTVPYYSFTIDSRDDVETTALLLAVGLTVGELVVRARRSRQLARASRRELEQMRRVVELAAGGGTAGRLINVVQRELVDVLGARGVRFERPPFSTRLPQLGHGKVVLSAGGSASGPASAAPGNEFELPVWGGGREIGRLVVVMPADSNAAGLPAADRALAVALTDQLGAVLAAAGRARDA
jgi:hypothetical protein